LGSELDSTHPSFYPGAQVFDPLEVRFELLELARCGLGHMPTAMAGRQATPRSFELGRIPRILEDRRASRAKSQGERGANRARAAELAKVPIAGAAAAEASEQNISIELAQLGERHRS
jgi:hypothetical protein